MSTPGGVGEDPELRAFDPLGLAEALQAGLGGGAAGGELRERLAAVTGRAESPDGVVRVEVDQQGRLRELYLDPRAMRLPSADLAALVVRLSDEALADAGRQITAVVGDPARLASRLDPAAIRDRLADVTASFQRMSSMSRDDFEALQRRLRG